MGRIDGERIYDGSGRQIGRADGLRRRLKHFAIFLFKINKLADHAGAKVV
jgi:hypothetical protein